MDTIFTAALDRKQALKDQIRGDYLIKANLLRRKPAEAFESVAGYCIDAPDEIPAGGFVERSFGVWGVFASETVTR